MLEKININNKYLEVFVNKRFASTKEADTYLAKYKNEFKVVKIFNDKSIIDNKIKKILLLKDRLKNQECVATADAFITKNKNIIGYMMPYIEGKNRYYNEIPSKKDSIIYLKEIAKLIKRIHKLNIVLTDFHGNIITTKDNKLYLIDHDNFSIDNLPVDKKNIYLQKYEENISKFDKMFDYYMLNIYTIALLKRIDTPSIYDLYERNPFEFDFKDKEIKEIFNKTMNLDKIYEEELLIDKINSPKDLKKIRTKMF